MSKDNDEVIKRINEEAKAQTGLLDLSCLDASKFTDEICGLGHLKYLFLGQYEDVELENGEATFTYVYLNERTKSPDISKILMSLVALKGLYLRRLETSQLNIERSLNLSDLDCSYTQVSDLSPLGKLTALTSVNCSYTQVSDLSPLGELTALTSINCSDTQVSDISPLGKLKALTSINCSDTQVSDLSPLSKLTGLTSVDCSYAQVSDLSPLSKLTALTSINCSETQVTDLSLLSKLTALTSINCSETKVSDLSPLSKLTALTSVDCDSTQVSDLSPLSKLTALTSVDCDSTQVSDLSPLSKLTALTSVNFARTQVSDLSPLGKLTALTSVDCYITKVSDLSPLRKLTALTSVNFARTQVSDLSPLSKLTALTSVNFVRTQVSDLSPLSKLAALTSVNFALTQVSDLSPLSKLTALTSVDCHGTQVSDLSPLGKLLALTTINCSNTQVSDLSEIFNKKITSLGISVSNLKTPNEISRFTDLLHLTLWGDTEQHVPIDFTENNANLQLSSIFIVGCNVKGFCALKNNKSLRTFDILFSTIDAISEEIILQSRDLSIIATNVRGIPSEVLSGSNTRSNLLAHFEDLKAGHCDRSRTKLMLLGNGQIGKTQLGRVLSGKAFNPNIPSTHGIFLDKFDVGDDKHGDFKEVRIWDFGGQDLYLGLHSLFMKSRAIFCVCWMPDTETGFEQAPDGKRYERRPLAFWLDMVKNAAGQKWPVLPVQLQCKSKFNETALPHSALATSQTFDRSAELSVCVDPPRGISHLKETIAESLTWIDEEYGKEAVGQGRVDVINQLEILIDADRAKPEDERSARTMSWRAFEKLCDDTGNISSTDAFAQYLHNCGLVFYHKDLFDNQIVLDQSWALGAIYAIFDRDQSVDILKDNQGKFKRSLLNAIVWVDYSEQEQKLFLGMMETVGLIFKLDSHTHVDAVYLAPDFLPERIGTDETLEGYWNPSEPGMTITYQCPFLHPALMRSLISQVGQNARRDAKYWKDGLAIYDARTGAAARIDLERDEDWSGRIIVTAQNGRLEDLARIVHGIIEEIIKSLNLDVKTETDIDLSRDEKILLETKADDAVTGEINVKNNASKNAMSALQLQTPAGAQREYAVSYAWGDDSKIGKQHESEVENLCKEADKLGQRILWDKRNVAFGDSLQNFMDKVGKANRVLIFLNSRYLLRPNTMNELYTAWVHNGQDAEKFKKATRFYLKDDFSVDLPFLRSEGFDEADSIFKPGTRYKCAEFWSRKAKMIETIKEPALMGRGYTHFLNYNRFAYAIADILDVVTDTRHPLLFDDFLKTGFNIES